MSLQHLPLPQINEAELQRLLSDGVRESRSIEYKREWRLNDNDDKKEFLADVASFANGDGGDLIYGIDAKDGIPVALVGLAGFAPEQEQLRVEQLAASWIDPRLAGLSLKPVFLLELPGFYHAHGTGSRRLLGVLFPSPSRDAFPVGLPFGMPCDDSRLAHQFFALDKTASSTDGPSQQETRNTLMKATTASSLAWL